MPPKVKTIANITDIVSFSLKNKLIIIATITGYINRIVHAIPESIYLNAENKVKDESEKFNPKNKNENISDFETFNDNFLKNFNQTQ